MNGDSLKGKVVLITGAGSGLGEATARAFAHAGCSVACVDIDGKSAGRVSRDLISQDTGSIAIQCDVSDAEAVTHTVQMVHEQFGRLDIIVNCAAIDYTRSVDELTIEQWDRVIAINLRGPFLFAKAALPIMRRQHTGHLLNIASTPATRAWANAPTHPPSKHRLLCLH